MRQRAAYSLPFLAALLCAAGSAGAQESCHGAPSGIRLIVQVENVRSDQGWITVTLYGDNPRRFLARHGSLSIARVPARTGTTRACLFLPAFGTYAVAVYHDADSSRRLNRGRLGFPTEGGGFSNNPRILFGPPAFRSVRFDVPRSGLRATVRLRYP